MRRGSVGVDGSRPDGVRARSWRDVLAGVRKGVREDKLVLVAAGVAFYAMVALVPALAALVSVYGLFWDPATIQGQLDQIARAVPDEVTSIVTEELRRLTASGPTSLSIGFVIATVVSLWSASAAVQALVDAVGIGYHGNEERGFVKRRGLALVLTSGAVVLAAVVLALIVVLPAVMGHLRVADAVRTLVSVVRWPLLAVLMVFGLEVLYRLGSPRPESKLRWVSPGALVGAALWLAGSGLFSFYVSELGRYNETHGSLGAVLVLLLWLWISALAVLVGARVDAEFEDADAGESAGAPMADAAAADRA